MIFVRIVVLSVSVGASLASYAQDSVGPATEKRFPPLVVPEGFKATLFACDPLVEYPSVIAIGPRYGTLFVAHDYVTGLGVEIVRRDEIRLLDDTNRDGYADRSTVYAGGFNSIQGLAYSDGAVYVMHAPLLTALRDTDGDGVADERRDLIKGLGLPPEENSNRLHCANGVAVGHDGWLYLALGDRGCDVQRPEGDRLLFQQGGILRCRTDGTDLHVLSTGLRNIYDVALDDELNVFVRDNENDGGDYMIRVLHCFHGSDHGYPYHYYERPDEAMTPMADLGRGSSAGGVCYTGTNFPAEYHRNLFFCEWGRAVVRYPRERSGSGFAPTREIDFAAAAENDPYGLKPTDLVVDYDGSLLISDWGDGQRPKRGRGRIYRVKAESSGRSKGSITADDRLHAVWRLAREDDAVARLFEIASRDPVASVRAQAIRAIADVTDPILVHDRLDGGRGDQELAARLAELSDREDDGRVKLEVLIALRRLKWEDAPHWLASTITRTEPAWTHAAMQLLRGCDNWPGVLTLLDRPTESGLRTIALRAIAEEAELAIADGVVERLGKESDPTRRRQLADALTRLHRKPAPWTYWGFRPGPRPANSQDWERTEAIARALDRMLADEDQNVRAFVLARMLREEITIRLETLASWLREKTEKQHVVAIIRALQKRPAKEIRPLLKEVVANNDRSANDSRLSALKLLVSGFDDATESVLLDLATHVDDGPVLAATLAELGARRKLDADEILLAKLDSREPVVRAAAIRALSDRDASAGREHVARLLKDKMLEVQTAAVVAAGVLKPKGVNDRVLELAADSDQELRRECLTALKELEDPRAVDIAAESLREPNTQIAALQYLDEFGDHRQLEAVVVAAAQSLDAEVHRAAVVALSLWQDRASGDVAEMLQVEIAKLHTATGAPRRWHTKSTDYFASGIDAQVLCLVTDVDESGWHATTQVHANQEMDVEFLASSNGTLRVWRNDKQIFDRQKKTTYKPDSDRFTTKLAAGMNQLAVRITNAGDSPRFHLRFRARSSKAEHERLMQFVLSGQGNAQRGREVFQNAEKSLCLKCHRLGTEGGKIGPDLAGMGSRFSRVHILESILEPSRTVAPSYGTIVVALANGQVLSGVKIAEDDDALTLGDTQGKTHQIPKADIEERQLQSKSTMPEGLEKKLSDREFLDLITYLTSLTKRSK
jgi:putative membrane-bound dehydrogenase-like protein